MAEHDEDTISHLASVMDITCKVPTIDLGTNTTNTKFPSTWFEKNGNQPPTLSIKLTANSLEEISGVINDPMKIHELRIEDACTFLFYKFQTIKEKTTAQWKSYNYVIAEAGSDITPLSMLKVKSFVVETTVGGTSTDIPEDAKLLYILCIYRILNLTNGALREQTIQKLTTMMKKYQPGNQILQFSEAMFFLYSSSTFTWIKSKTYNALIACFDMFMNKFPNNKYRQMTIGTMGTRMKDCAALTSVKYITECMGYSGLKEFSQWIFVMDVGKEFIKMFEKKEESDVPDSYFPYQVHLGLTQKSPYSSVANPYLFFYVHVMGCMIANKRSMNAIFSVKANSIPLIIKNAVISAYYKSEKSGLFDQEALSKIWDNLPDEIQVYYRSKQKHLVRCRKGTIGEYVLKFDTPLIVGKERNVMSLWVDECESHPGQNHGICLDLHADFMCACAFGYTGKRCEVKIEFCGDSSCSNNAICVVEDGDVCYCVPDYHGALCELQYDECLLGPGCTNGSTVVASWTFTFVVYGSTLLL